MVRHARQPLLASFSMLFKKPNAAFDYKAAVRLCLFHLSRAITEPFRRIASKAVMQGTPRIGCVCLGLRVASPPTVSGIHRSTTHCLGGTCCVRPWLLSTPVAPASATNLAETHCVEQTSARLRQIQFAWGAVPLSSQDKKRKAEAPAEVKEAKEAKAQKGTLIKKRAQKGTRLSDFQELQKFQGKPLVALLVSLLSGRRGLNPLEPNQPERNQP